MVQRPIFNVTHSDKGQFIKSEKLRNEGEIFPLKTASMQSVMHMIEEIGANFVLNNILL